MQQTTGARANALKRELAIAAEATGRASVEQVYDVLADLRSHRIWAGERQKKSGRLLSIDAPEGAASVGTEFTTTGSDPMGRFTDRSVVTEARRPTEFEFVTESRLETKKGEVAEWTIVHRYELTPSGNGCRAVYSILVTRISALPGMLRLFNTPVLSVLIRKVATGVARRGVRNLVALAEERAGAR
jgi:Polyketide cyclase / dehydrase and lipid transport